MPWPCTIPSQILNRMRRGSWKSDVGKPFRLEAFPVGITRAVRAGQERTELSGRDMEVGRKTGGIELGILEV